MAGNKLLDTIRSVEDKFTDSVKEILKTTYGMDVNDIVSNPNKYINILKMYQYDGVKGNIFETYKVFTVLYEGDEYAVASLITSMDNDLTLKLGSYSTYIKFDIFEYKIKIKFEDFKKRFKLD